MEKVEWDGSIDNEQGFRKLKTCLSLIPFAFVLWAASCSEPPRVSTTVVIISTSFLDDDDPAKQIEIGDHVATDAVISLAEREHIAFFDASGRLQYVYGPYSGSIAEKAVIATQTNAGQEFLLSLSEYLEGIDRKRRLPGATRTGADNGPWPIPVSALFEEQPVCIPNDRDAIWWRAPTEAQGDVSFTLTPAAGDVVNLSFAAGQTLASSSSQPNLPGSYRLAIDGTGRKPVSLTAFQTEDYASIPLALHKRGCTLQFQSLILEIAGLG